MKSVCLRILIASTMYLENLHIDNISPYSDEITLRLTQRSTSLWSYFGLVQDQSYFVAEANFVLQKDHVQVSDMNVNEQKGSKVAYQYGEPLSRSMAMNLYGDLFKFGECLAEEQNFTKSIIDVDPDLIAFTDHIATFGYILNGKRSNDGFGMFLQAQKDL